jgi:hypothetical protein
MKSARYWIGRLGLALGALALLAGCGAAPVAEGQVGSVADQRPAQASGLDQDLLRQVDQALAQKKAAGEDVTGAQVFRDTAVQQGQAGRAEEANGNLKSAAMLLGVLKSVGGPPPAKEPLPKAPQLPPAPSSAQGATVINATFGSADALKSWERVGPDIPTGGTPLWEAKDGMLVQRGLDGIDAVDVQTGLVTGDATWQEVAVRATVLARDTKEVGLIVRQSGKSYYQFRALVLGTGTATGNLILEKVVGDQVTKIATFDGPELSSGAWHVLGLSAKGSTITASVDGKNVGSAQDSSLTSGRAGVSTLAMSGAYFASVQVIGR